MLLTKAILALALPLALVGAISDYEASENVPPKSEIVFRIKRLLQILRDKKKYEEKKEEQEQKPLSSRSMLERRKRLEEVLRENPGLRALIKDSLKNRHEEEVRMLENDPRRRCRPGIFFCKKSGDSNFDNEDKRDEELTKLSKFDDEITKRRRCRPGIFWCLKRDSSFDSEKIASQTQKKSSKVLETIAKDNIVKHSETGQELMDRLMTIMEEKQQDPQKRRRCRPGMFHCVQGDEGSNVEILRMPAEKRKRTRTSDAAKEDAERRQVEIENVSKGEKLADDLMNSVDTNKNVEANDSPQNEKTSFNIDQLAKILESSKR